MLSLTSLKTAVLGGLLSEVGACRVGGLADVCWVGVGLVGGWKTWK